MRQEQNSRLPVTSAIFVGCDRRECKRGGDEYRD
jgi:hypothetical protein